MQSSTRWLTTTIRWVFIAAVFGFCICLAVAIFWDPQPLGSVFSETKVFSAKEAREYHEKRMSEIVRLPAQANVSEVVVRTEWVDESYDIQFSLPNTRKATDWLQQMAVRNALPDTVNESDAGLLQVNGKLMCGDDARIEYDQKDRVFRAITYDY